MASRFCCVLPRVFLFSATLVRKSSDNRVHDHHDFPQFFFFCGFGLAGVNDGKLAAETAGNGGQNARPEYLESLLGKT